MTDAQSVVVEQTLYRARPDVSIDGKRFVYSSTRGAADQFSNLYVQPVAGGEPYKLTFFGHDAFHPRWSPDGESIAYIDNREGLPQLALLDVYGGANRIVRIVDRRWKRPMGVLSARSWTTVGTSLEHEST
jgi:Tol biopolymer transport system component